MKAVAAAGHGEDGGEGDFLLLGDAVDVFVRCAVDNSRWVYSVPGGDECVDFVGVGKEGVCRFIAVHQVEQGRWIFCGRRQCKNEC